MKKIWRENIDFIYLTAFLSLAGACFFSGWVFFQIIFRGRLVFIEPNPVIIAIEFVGSAIMLLFALTLSVMVFRKLWIDAAYRRARSAGPLACDDPVSQNKKG